MYASQVLSTDYEWLTASQTSPTSFRQMGPNTMICTVPLMIPLFSSFV